MRRLIFNIILTLIILIIPLCGLGYLGTMVSYKYEVDHARTFIAIDRDEMTEEQIINKQTEINELEQSIITQRYWLIAISLFAFITAITLVIKRNRIIKNGAQH